MGRSKQTRVGDVQSSYINALRASLLKKAGGYDPMDMSFASGANFAVVVGMSYLHAPAYRDRVTDEGEHMGLDEAAADLAAHYIDSGDVTQEMKARFEIEAETFAQMVVLALITPEPGQPSNDHLEDVTINPAELDTLFTAETPGEGGR